MKIVGFTRLIQEGMPTFPTVPPPKIEGLKDVRRDKVDTQFFTFPSHSGTTSTPRCTLSQVGRPWTRSASKSLSATR